jgi:hypothetical protein
VRGRAGIPNVFGQARKPAKMFRTGLYPRISTNDRQTLARISQHPFYCGAR